MRPGSRRPRRRSSSHRPRVCRVRPVRRRSPVDLRGRRLRRGRRRRRGRRGLEHRHPPQDQRALRGRDRAAARRPDDREPAVPCPAARARPGAGRAWRHGARDGCRATHLARAVARRAVVDGQHRRLPRGHRGRPRVRLALHRSGDGGGQGAAGQGPRGRRRRGRARRRSARPARSARWCGRSTRAARWPSRSSRWGRSSCGSTSRTPARRPTATPRRPARTSTARRQSCMPRRPRTSTSSSPPR